MRGFVHLYNKDDINTDEILPARYMNVFEEKAMAAHCLEDLDTEFIKKVKTGDFIVAGNNFGCGSSREHAIWALRGAGIKAVIASSFARIFLRNAINNGFLVIELEGAHEKFLDGHELIIEPLDGLVININTREEIKFVSMPKFAMDIIDKGGLLEYVKGGN